MSLNSKKAPESKKGLDLPLIEEDTYPARLRTIIDVGQHEIFYEKKSKGVRQLVNYLFELTDEVVTIENDDGEEEDITRWIALSNSSLFNQSIEDLDEKSWQYKILKAMDPLNKTDGDISQLLGKPVLISVVHKPIKGGQNQGKLRARIGSLSKPMKGQKVSPLTGEAQLFDFDEPSLEVFESQPDFVQEKIKAAVNFPEIEKKLYAEGDEEISEAEEDELPEAKPKKKQPKKSTTPKTRAKRTVKKKVEEEVVEEAGPELEDDDDDDEY